MENWYSRETLLKLFGILHHESLQNEDLATKNLLNLLDDFQTKSLQDKKDDMRKLYEGLDARSKQEAKERYGRSLHYKRTVNAAAPKFIPRTLDMLPPEMLIQICDFADPKSLIALRRTCRIISQCALTPFCNVHFSERRHILSRHSLEELVKITAHPVFGPFVRTIKLGSCRLSANAFQNLDMMEDEHHPGGLMALKQAKDDIYLTVSEQGNLEYRQQGSAVLWLRHALNNIHGWGHEPTLEAWVDVLTDSSAANDPTYFKSSDSESATFFGAWGSLKAYSGGIKAATAQNYLTFEDRPYATMKLLLRAAHQSNCTVERFGLSIRTSESSVLYPSFGLLHEEDVHAQLSSLQSLSINACSRASGMGIDFYTILFIESLIKRTPNLTECSLNGIRIAPGRTELINSLGDLRLHTLHLSDFETNGLVLFKILKKQHSTLKVLSLKSLRFDSGRKDMEALFLWMAGNLPLDTLDISNLRVDRSRKEISLPLSKEQITYKGTKQVLEGLKELLEMLKDPKKFLARPSPPTQFTPNSSTTQQTPFPRLVPVFAPPLVSAATSAPINSPLAAPAPAPTPAPADARVPIIASASAVAHVMTFPSSQTSIPTLTAAAVAPATPHLWGASSCWRRKQNANIGDTTRFSSKQGAPSRDSKAQTVEAPPSGPWCTAGLLAALPTSAGSISISSIQSPQATQRQNDERTYPRSPLATSTLPNARVKPLTPQHFQETGSQMFEIFVNKSKNQRLLKDEVISDTGTNSLPDQTHKVQRELETEAIPTTDPSTSS